jgi:hypothetical protein
VSVRHDAIVGIRDARKRSARRCSSLRNVCPQPRGSSQPTHPMQLVQGLTRLTVSVIFTLTVPPFQKLCEILISINRLDFMAGNLQTSFREGRKEMLL